VKRLLVIGMLVAAAACRRETRTFREQPPASPQVDAITLTDFSAGGPRPPANIASPFRENAYGISEGKRLFAQMNCVGCHAYGGGGIGPALMDSKWIYGARPAQIYSSIVEGRPNGMPAWGGKLSDQQVWQLVAYIESLSAMVPRDAAPSRNDDMSIRKPELRLPERGPIQTGQR
jgi:cytochrome c oxidase cbb3-type subunit 3